VSPASISPLLLPLAPLEELDEDDDDDEEEEEEDEDDDASPSPVTSYSLRPVTRAHADARQPATTLATRNVPRAR